MDDNDELQLARQLIENTGTHLFLTGKAGTGKTTFLRRLKQESPKRMVVLAPTGIAAINAGGTTLHSFFQLPFAPFVPDSTFHSSQAHFRFSKEKINIIRSMDLLVIDEISMVRADLLDAVDDVLRRYRDRYKPFGGVQLLVIGDLQQLAPVVKDEEWHILSPYYTTPYFFGSNALKQTSFVTIELKQVYRQSDSSFLRLLNQIREDKADQEVLRQLNERYLPGFVPPKEDGYIHLTTHNYQAQQINASALSRLSEKAHRFKAEITGNFPEYSYPTDETLTLKIGAQIMFVKNDPSPEKRFYNGMIGEIIFIGSHGFMVQSKEEGETLMVLPEEWNNYKYTLNDDTKEITEEVEGTFRQYPVKLAWAITIHKSQGLTFKHAIIDAHSAFAHGQTYVALSRCKTLEGLVLSTPIEQQAIISDQTVSAFTATMAERVPDRQQLEQLQQAYFLELINDLFHFQAIDQSFKEMMRLIDEHFYRLYPALLKEYKEAYPVFTEKILKVAQHFQKEYTRLIYESTDYAENTALQERLHKGASYFFEALIPTTLLTVKTQISTDNKELQKRATTALENFDGALRIKIELLSHIVHKGFRINDYLKTKACLSLEEKQVPSKKQEERASKKSKPTELPTDIIHPELFNQLKEWRGARAKELNIPAYCIIQQKALIGMSNLLPETAEALAAVPYFGKKSVENHGLEILKIITDYKKTL